MLKLRLCRTVAISLAAGAMLVAVLSAQSGPSPVAQSSSQDALLAEMKALRADLNQRLDASIRAQLLVARLQVQEQRISTLTRQMTDIQQQLQNSEQARSPLEMQLKNFEAAHATSTEAEKQEAQFFLGTLRSQVEAMTKNDEELRRQHLYLSGLMADEQSRWTTFNARLEELEQLLTANPAPRR